MHAIPALCILGIVSNPSFYSQCCTKSHVSGDYMRAMQASYLMDAQLNMGPGRHEQSTSDRCDVNQMG